MKPPKWLWHSYSPSRNAILQVCKNLTTFSHFPEMDWIKCLVAGSLVIMIRSDADSALSPRLVEVINSLNGSAGDDIRVEFYYAYMGLIYPNFEKQMQSDLHPLKCYHRLFGIMKTDLKCPMAAREFRVFLDVMEYHFKDIEDVGVWPFLRAFSMFERDCSALSGKHAEICELRLSKSNDTHSHLNIPSMIDKCFLESRKNKMLFFR